MIAIVSLVAAVAVAIPTSGGSEEFGDAETIAIKNRAAVKTIHATFQHVLRSRADPSDSRKSEVETWSEGVFLRSDHIDHYPGLGEQAGKRYVECFNCERMGDHLTYPELPSVAMQIRPTGGAKFVAAMPTFDPRLVGYALSSFGMLTSARIDDVVGRAGREGVRQSREVLGSTDCLVVRSTRAKGQIALAVWLDPARGYHPLRLVSEEGGSGDAAQFRQEMTVKLQQAGPGLWYPAETTYKRSTLGKVLSEEVVTVTSVQINQPIAKETFSLAGLGLKDDTHIYWRGRKPASWVWKSNKLISYNDIERQREASQSVTVVPATPLKPQSSRRVWLYSLAGLLVIAGLFVVRRALRHRSVSGEQR